MVCLSIGTNMEKITAGEFKAKCLQLMNYVSQTHEELLITKRGIPIAKMVPIDKPKNPFGFLKDTVILKEDIVCDSIGETWEVDT